MKACLSNKDLLKHHYLLFANRHFIGSLFLMISANVMANYLTSVMSVFVGLTLTLILGRFKLALSL